MHWRKINIEDLPKGTVISRYNGEEEPVIGELFVSKGKIYCELPYYHHDDGCYYREEVDEFITLYDFNNAIDASPHGTQE